MQKTVPELYVAACFALLGHCCWRKLLHHWMFLCMFLWFLVVFGEVAWWFLLCLWPLPAPVPVPVTLVASGSCFCSCGCHWFLFLLLLLCLLVLLLLLHFLDSWSVIAAGLSWVCLLVFGLTICHDFAASPVSFEQCFLKNCYSCKFRCLDCCLFWVPLVDAHCSWHSLVFKQRLCCNSIAGAYVFSFWNLHVVCWGLVLVARTVIQIKPKSTLLCWAVCCLAKI